MAQTKVGFNSLKELTVTGRKKVLSDPKIGPPLASLLTPTDIAMLFPDYYKRRLPDVDGFRQYLTQASQQKPKDTGGVIDSLKKTAEIVKEKGGELLNWGKKFAKETFKEQRATPVPQMTEKQAKAFEEIKKGSVEVGSEAGKVFNVIPDKELHTVGIVKQKDEKTGKDVYVYTAPEVTKEEAVGKLTTLAQDSFTGREKAVLDMIAKREGATDPNTIFGGEKYKSAVGYNKPLTEMTINEVLAMQKRLTSVTAAHGEANGRGTSAVGSGQFVRATLISNLKKLGITEDKWDKVKFDHTLQKRVTIQNFRDTVGDPNEPRTWNLQRLGAQWESFDVNKGKPPLKTSELNSVYAASTDRPKPAAGGKFSDEQIKETMDQLRQEKDVARRAQLSRLLQENGVPVIDKGPATTADATNKWSSISVMGGQSKCGQGVAHLARQIFGSNEHLNGHLNTNYASDLSYGSRENNTFTRSGFYKAGTPVSKDNLTPEFLKTLPPGTIISAGGGRSDGAGHIQMKVGDRWASDHWQSGFSFGRRDGRMYKDFVIHYPSERGMAAMQEKGFITNAKISPQVEATPTPSPTYAPREREVKDDKSQTKIQPNEQQQIIKSKEEVNAKPTDVEQPNAQVPAHAQVPPQVQAPAQVQEPTATVMPPNKYKVNRQGFINAIKETPEFKNHPLAWMATDQMIIDGFNTDPKVADAGVKYDTTSGTMTFKDPNNPQIKQMMKDMKTDRFMTPIQEKKTEVKPMEQKKVEATKEVKTEVKPMEQKKVEATKEVMKKSDTPTKVDVAPMDKAKNVPGPAPDQTKNELNSIREDVNTALANSSKAKEQPAKQMPEKITDNPASHDINMRRPSVPLNTPSFHRAMTRTRFDETGDGMTDHHFSYGNAK